MFREHQRQREPTSSPAFSREHDRERERFEPGRQVAREDPFASPRRRAFDLPGAREDPFVFPRRQDVAFPGQPFGPFVHVDRMREMWLPAIPRPSRRPSASPPRERPQPPPQRRPASPARERPAFHAEHTIYDGRESSSGDRYYAKRERVIYPNGRSLEYRDTQRDKDWTELWVETAIYFKHGKETHRASKLHITKSDLPNASPIFVRKESQISGPAA